MNLRGAVQSLVLPEVFHFNHDLHRAARRQFLQAPGDGGQGGFVANQPVTVEDVGDDHRAARAGNVQVLARLRTGGPCGRRAVAMQHEVDVQFASCEVNPTRGVVAHRGLGTVAVTVGARCPILQGGDFLGSAGKQQLDVVIATQAGKARQFAATQGDAAHARGQVGDP
ncbi:hypothetical protein D9M71_105180 [compost metagenome]